MALSESDKVSLKRQIVDLEKDIEAQKNASGGIEEKIKRLEADDAVYKKQWDFNNSIIYSYEKEIRRLNGTFIASPILEQDLIDHALEKGRLYQGVVSQDPKVIPEFNGGGLSPILDILHELDMITKLNAIINLLKNGTGGVNPSTTLDQAYVAGSSSFVAKGNLTPNTWYLLGNDTLVKVGSVSSEETGTCSLSQYTTESSCLSHMGTWTSTGFAYTAQIIERFSYIDGLDVNVNDNASVSVFTGYTNAERTSKVASTTTQRMFNAIYNGGLKKYVNLLSSAVNEEVSILSENQDPNLNQTDKTNTSNLKSNLDTYKITYPIQNGTPGIDQLSTLLSDRNSFIPGRVTRATQAKYAYYPARVNFSKLRSNVQEGTLSRVQFLKTSVGPSFPPGGNVESLKRLNDLKALLS